MEFKIGPAGILELNQVVEDHHRYWGDRDLRAGQRAEMVHEFGSTCFAARADAGILGYLLGFVTPTGTGYVHMIATRDDARGLGVARRLYEAFTEAAVNQGAVRLKAITSVANTGSVAFHRSIGFRDEIVEDYLGPGKPMVVFRKEV